MSSSAPTAPARLVGPCITLASSCTTPSAFGRPPSPTDWSFGSSSWMLTPAIAASSGSLPATIRSYATFTPRMPLSLAMTTGRPANGSFACGSRSATRMSGCAFAMRGRARLAAVSAEAPRKSRREMDTNGSPMKGSDRPQRNYRNEREFARAPEQGVLPRERAQRAP